MKMQWAMNLPEAWRLLRVGLRKGRGVGYALVSLFVCMLCCLFSYIAYKNSSVDDRISDWNIAVSTYSILIFAYHCLLWLFFVPLAAGDSLIKEFSTNTWIFQQTSPQPARKLLLGKLLGAPGTVYAASLTTIPFMAAIIIFKPHFFIPFCFILIFVFVLSFMISSVLLYCSSILSGHQSTAMPAMLLLIVFFSLGTTRLFSYANSRGEFNDLHPIMVLSEFSHIMEDAEKPFVLIYNPDSNRLKPTTHYYSNKVDPHVNFFNVSFGLLPFACFFYFVWGMVIFISTEGQLLRKMGMGRNRLPLIIPFTLLGFFAMGFGSFGGNAEAMLVLYKTICWILLMGVVLQHARPLNELRPWLYRMGNGRSFKDYFSDDSPSISIILLLLSISIVGFSLFMSDLHDYSKGDTLYYFIPLLFYSIIILRDTLLIECLRMNVKKPDMKIALIYGLAFAGTSLAGLIAARGHGVVLDLTPVTALAAESPNFIKHNPSIVYSYIIINGGLALLFGAINFLQLRKIHARFKVEDEISPIA